MKILHTSDWHLGRTLYGRKRYAEFVLFLDWLYTAITKESVDILLVCGDIFDTSTPSNKAQELYYQFLCKVSLSSCKHVVIIAGNHDSPSFLEAPKNLLHALNVHVIGMIDNTNIEKELIVLEQNNVPQAIICAVPYLRDKEIRMAEAGEDIDQKNTKLLIGIQNHYEQISKLADQKQTELCKRTGIKVPIIATGHLFAAGSITMSDDGVRDLYVGSLVNIGSDTFPSNFDYVALGHLHIAQRVSKNDFIRYCGSPIPMGFGEAPQHKKVLILTINNEKKEIEEINVPCFQDLVRISGTLQEIIDKIEGLKNDHNTSQSETPKNLPNNSLNNVSNNTSSDLPHSASGKMSGVISASTSDAPNNVSSNAWLEIEYTGAELVPNLRESIEEAIASTNMEIRRIRNMRITEQAMNAMNAGENLSDLNEKEVFQRCLEAFQVPAEERDLLSTSYNEILQELQEQDKNAE